ncbi:hypothetical protein BD626DRAFT_557818 [Schizophyllum amplum]|uniref:Uncharacterized protein n=1 Tax=Schizophyllum amplum TaxID=97359 RepID=A0A550CDQ9_9AGAR|nr:hypothetical protein BD626DRAFT_557818 [Auriculariopsis ampla]
MSQASNTNLTVYGHYRTGSDSASSSRAPGLSQRPSQTSINTPTSALPPARTTSFVVISGGTGGNAICSAFAQSPTSHVLPVSDDGGSSSEIIRVLGGPSIGDIRSRLVRLIPACPPGSPLDAIRNLLSYRLPTTLSDREARDQWRDIVEGNSALWNGIPGDRKETIRGFLVYFESELLRRAHKNFSFVNGSIGNYFLAAAQNFFRSLPSAIFLFSSITNGNTAANALLPAIVTNHTVTIAAELDNGEKLVGQCEISHPVQTLPALDGPPRFTLTDLDKTEDDDDGIQAGQLNQNNAKFDHQAGKEEYRPLGARISRLYYINAYGMEIHPSPNPEYINSLNRADVLVYSCGSLWTSIMPCLALRGVASAIARSRSLRAKILLLNSKNDRETDGYSATDYVLAIANTLNTQYGHGRAYAGLGNATTRYPISAFVTDLVYTQEAQVDVDVAKITVSPFVLRRILLLTIIAVVGRTMHTHRGSLL